MKNLLSEKSLKLQNSSHLTLSAMGKKNSESNKWTDAQKKKWGQRKHGRHRLHYQTWTSYAQRHRQKK